jgi:hypothetical protein
MNLTLDVDRFTQHYPLIRPTASFSPKGEQPRQALASFSPRRDAVKHFRKGPMKMFNRR